MTRSTRLALRLLTLSMTVPACLRSQTPDGTGSLPSALVVPPDATRVEKKSGGGMFGVTYEMEALFPALVPIDDVCRHMSKLGWKPLKEDWLNPGIPTSFVRGWSSFIDASKSVRVRRYAWASDWRSPEGQIASYSFTYVDPDVGHSPLTRLMVHASVYPEKVANEARERSRRLSKQIEPQVERSAEYAGPEEDSIRTVEPAKAGDEFLLSNHLGEAIVQITAAEGRQVSYRWRFRTGDAGTESKGQAPASSSIQAGPFRLFWRTDTGMLDEGAVGVVGFYEKQIKVVPLPSDLFESVDLAAFHRLATMAPDRNFAYSKFHEPVGQVLSDRSVAFMESGKAVVVQKGQAILVSGPRGRGVLEIESIATRSVGYRWRFRDPSSAADLAGTSQGEGLHSQALHIGPYEVQWETVSLSTYKDEKVKRVTDWIGRVRYFPEEVSVEPLDSMTAASMDLAAIPPMKRRAPAPGR